MDFIKTCFEWVMNHKTDIVAVYGLIVAAATIVVKLTPSEKDDTILGKIVAFLDNFSTAFRKSDAEKLEKLEKPETLENLEKLESGEYKLTKVKK